MSRIPAIGGKDAPTDALICSRVIPEPCPNVNNAMSAVSSRANMG